MHRAKWIRDDLYSVRHKLIMLGIPRCCCSDALVPNISPRRGTDSNEYQLIFYHTERKTKYYENL